MLSSDEQYAQYVQVFAQVVKFVLQWPIQINLQVYL